MLPKWCDLDREIFAFLVFLRTSFDRVEVFFFVPRRIARFHPRPLIAAMFLSRFRAVNEIRSHDIRVAREWRMNPLPRPQRFGRVSENEIARVFPRWRVRIADGRRKNGRRVEEISERLLARKTARSASRRMANGSWRTRKRGGQSMPTEPFAHKSCSSSV